MRKIRDLYFQTADVIRGLKLEVRHKVNCIVARKGGNEMVVYAVRNGVLPSVIVSDKPFGSAWLTRRSKVWRSRTNYAFHYLMRHAGNDGIALSKSTFDSLTLKRIKTKP